MLEPGDDDLVVAADVLATPALRDEIDRLGGAADEDDLVGRGRVEEAADLVAGRLVGVGRARREFVGGAMDVRILVPIEVHQAVDDGLRLLRGGGVVQPDQRPAVHILAKDGEVPSDGIHVERRMCRRFRSGGGTPSECVPGNCPPGDDGCTPSRK